MKRVVMLGLLAVSVIGITMALGYLPWGETDPAPKPLDSHRPEAGDPPTQFTKVEFVGRKGGEKQYQFDFDIVFRTGDDALVTFEGLRDGVIFQDGEPAYNIVAKAGRWLEAQDNFELEGDITVTGTDELILRSQRLKWDGKDRIITIPVPAELTIDDIHATSQQMEAHMDSDRLYLQGDVTMWDGEHTIRADEVIYDRKADALYLIGPSEIDFLTGKTSR
ncbi:MAG: LPS export ABC transporter periplasmic protein LptC [Firmicutes bacterium]|nr:LPS export ABC transporter periplasmic protein LptC [Bacillota bacterium]